MIYNGMESKSVFLDNVTGNEIVQEQERINASDCMRVKATTILPALNEGKFFAFIYYDVKAGTVPSVNNVPTQTAQNVQQAIAPTQPQTQPQQQQQPQDMSMDTSKLI